MSGPQRRDAEKLLFLERHRDERVQQDTGEQPRVRKHRSVCVSMRSELACLYLETLREECDKAYQQNSSIMLH